ncbi:MAG TPA: glutathione S-transferase family protein [Caulobacteraceae bacterium]|nr:glutathione S-transferase family protein [Caulobacteraceae bacterium]
MIKVFHSPRSRSLRVIWMLEEMGLAYEVEPGSLMQPSEAFLKVNPTRTLPVLVDGDTVITESIAILQYLGTKYGPTPLVPSPEDAGYADYLQFLVLGEASLAAGLTPLVRAMFMAPEDQKQNWTLKNNAESFLKQLQLVDAQLAKGPYLAGNTFTAADISVGYALAFGTFLSLDDGYSAAIKDYQQRITGREAFQRASAVQ